VIEMQTLYYDKQITAKIATHIYEDAVVIAQKRGLCMAEYLRSLVNKDVLSERENFNMSK